MTSLPTSLPTSLTTRSGYSVTIRPVTPNDAPALAAFFVRVAPQDVRFRFLSAQSDVRPDQIAAMVAVDHKASEHLLAFDPATGTLVASALLAGDLPSRTAEVAISIAADYRDKGLGWTLLAHMADLAKALGFARLRSIESHANHAAIEVERALGFTTCEYEGDATMVLVEKDLG